MLKQQPEYDKAQLRGLREINRREPGKPHGHSRPDVPERFFEEPQSVTSLSGDYAWFWPALLYSIVGLDRSIVALFNSARRKTARVITSKTDAPIVRFKDSDWSANPTVYLLQGVEKSVEADFFGYVASYEFRAGPKVWRISPTRTRIADPFVKTERRGAECTLLLPQLISHNRKLVIRSDSGLLLNTPVLAVEHGL